MNDRCSTLKLDVLSVACEHQAPYRVPFASAVLVVVASLMTKVVLADEPAALIKDSPSIESFLHLVSDEVGVGYYFKPESDYFTYSFSKNVNSEAVLAFRHFLNRSEPVRGREEPGSQWKDKKVLITGLTVTGDGGSIAFEGWMQGLDIDCPFTAVFESHWTLDGGWKGYPNATWKQTHGECPSNVPVVDD